MSQPKLKQPFRKAGNPRWYICWCEGSKPFRVSTGTADEAAAKTFFGEWLLMNREPAANGSDLTVDELWAVYDKRHVQKKVASPATIAYCWQNLQPHFGRLTVSQLTQDMVDDYVRKRRAGKIGRPSKEPTIRKELGALYACLNFCADPKVKLIQKRLIEPVDLPEAGEPRDRWLTMDEVQRLLDAARAMRRGDRLSRLERFLWLALETAARKQAILDLTWDRVDFETGTIDLDVPGRKKTKKRRARVPISASLRPVLERAFQERTSDLVLDNKGAVWASVQLAAINAGFSTQTVTHGQKPKATGVSPHVFRHTAATHMARNGVHLWVIAKILGNSLAMVERVYAKWQPDDPAGTVDRISSGKLEAAE